MVDRRRFRRVRRLRRLAARPAAKRAVAAVLAAVAGALIYWVAVDLFPYLSTNDDEGVYLLQAAMLLEGQVNLYPGRLADLVRPWFFVVDRTTDAPGGVRMYPKYAPVAAAVFALGKATFGAWDPILGVVAAGNAALVYALTAAAYDRWTGLLAVVALVASPLFLLTSATHLSYAPTTLFTLTFGYGYVRAARAQAETGRSREAAGEGRATGGSLPARRTAGWAVLAGTAIGVAFFSRPYTAVLFALPFVGHALATLARTWRAGSASFRPVFARYLAVAVPGLAGVGAALGYNALVTGDPLLFPYAAFAPHDGLGFGWHRLLNYELRYTPALAVETTRRLLVEFATDWAPAGLLGTALALVGAALALVDAGRSRATVAEGATAVRRLLGTGPGMSSRELRVVLLGLSASVVLGNAYFWGTLNGLNNRLIHLLGPYYHFDLLLPLSAFVAAGALAAVAGVIRLLRARVGLSVRRTRTVLALLLLVATPAATVAAVDVAADPVAENRERTRNLAAVYAPFERTDLDHALVFTPDPWGDWQQHPFQYLRNDPGFDGDAVFVLDEGPAADWRAVDATANRTPYRFTYRGQWAGGTARVDPALQRLRVLRGERVAATTTVGLPEWAATASVRVETPSGYARYRVPDSRLRGGDLPVAWTVGPGGAGVTNLPLAAAGGSGAGNASGAGSAAGSGSAAPVPTGPAEVDLVVTIVGRSGSSITYRQELTVDAGPRVGADDGSEIRALWEPETRVCRLSTACGRGGTWVGPDGEYLDGVSVEMDARAADASATNASA